MTNTEGSSSIQRHKEMSYYNQICLLHKYADSFNWKSFLLQLIFCKKMKTSVNSNRNLKGPRAMFLKRQMKSSTNYQQLFQSKGHNA